ncbi:MAG: isoaspartyl peptidase/L-asparaginase [Candidatus Poseidoniaceae archaeon]|jgi:beta-aspartyl-peptidase (threonine type)|tara:strand:+ start:27900 stop:28880 length:981 start_codon:yes stop_codon:yes gene_type:complete
MAILALHGGAGGDGPWRGMTALDPQRLACMERILADLGPRLESGELDALEAVTLAVEAMEDEPLYNAGRGSVLAEDQRIYMDASIMRSSDQAAGSVVNIEATRHPIRAANLLLKDGWPVMMNAGAADAYAKKHGLEQTTQPWLKTDLRLAQWKKWSDLNSRPGATDEDDGAVLDHDLSGEEREGMGTVGAVALDINGQLAAATSTGGMTGKPVGRIGDTPIIGAGTWCDPTVAVSCTGVGEAFIRSCAAHEVAVQLRPEGVSLGDACAHVLAMVEPLGGRGGIIAVSQSGEVALPFQTMLMYRGLWRCGSITTGIGDEVYSSEKDD